jgi:formylglycine-generating enzyme required for sulfatase activity
MMPKIFISYRRKDTTPWVGRIYDRFIDEKRDSFPEKDVFRDIDNIPPGADFRVEVSQFLSDCDVVLVVIGDLWLSIQDPKTGTRRLDDPDDTLRIEVATALKREDDCLVIPLLIDGAPMPHRDMLPDDMKDLTFKNAKFIHDRSFSHDINGLIRFIKSQFPTHDDSQSSLPIDIDATFEEYEKARDNHLWANAKRLADLIRNSPHFDDAVIEGILNADAPEIHEGIRIAEEAKKAEEEVQRQHDFEAKRQKQYERLRLLIWDKKRFSPAYEAFSRAYPDYDPDPLGHFTSRVYDLLPQPFEWVHIPGGKVLLTPQEHDKKYSYLKADTLFNIPAFSIAKYPVTNAQYDEFVNHPDGYVNPEWWDYSDEAKEWRAGRPEMRPSKFDGDDCPRETVSWYDSVAFCRWLSAMTGDTITLPTDQQWQRAAIGDTNWGYPWGDNIDDTYANYDSNIGRTTPVTQYPKGASPYGVMDMSGNVFEWCLTEYNYGDINLIGDSIRVLHGGSWYYSDTYVRSASRNWDNPTNENNFVGFRCVRSNFLF